MERIVLEVDDAVGKLYRKMSNQSKQMLNQTISLMVKKAVNDVKFADYSRLLDEVGNEALSNGLTPEVLDALLSSDD